MQRGYENKKTIRANLQLLRNSTDLRYRQDACMKFVNKFIRFFEWYICEDRKTISGFYPIKSEINVLPALSYAESQGYQIALPYIDTSDVMQFARWSFGESTRLHPKFGFPEPVDTSNPIKPGIILIPLLGFDRRGNRIGYGMGYYDRTLKTAENVSAIRIGCAFSIQELGLIDASEDDAKLHFVITEKEIIKML